MSQENGLYYTRCHDGKVTYHDKVENVQFEIPEEDFAGLMLGQKMPSFEGANGCLDALRNPISSHTISQLVREKHAKTVSIIVSDGTRGVPTNAVSGLIIEELLAAGVKLEDILFIVATGCTARQTRQNTVRLWTKSTMAGSG